MITTNGELYQDGTITFNASTTQEPTGIELLARRAYPGLKHSELCSRHQHGYHFECRTCYPDWNALLDEHMKVFDQLYEQLLELSGLSDPPNGRIGTNAIVAEIRRKIGKKNS